MPTTTTAKENPLIRLRKGTTTMAIAALHRRAAVIAAGVAAVAGMTIASPVANAVTYHGAIAYSGSTGSGGSAWDHPTRESADRMALSYCGYTDCTVLVDFTECGAVAENSTAYHGGYGPTLSAAMSDALSHLPGSWILAWACN